MATTVMVGMLAALAMVTLAVPAGAQADVCTFTVNEAGRPASVSVSGTAPGSTEVLVYLNDDLVGSDTSDAAPPDAAAWGPVVVNLPTAPGTYNISVRLEDAAGQAYANALCIGPNGAEIYPIVVGGAAAALPYTGSDSTQYVVPALAAIAVGLVLVVSVRRRRSVHTST